MGDNELSSSSAHDTELSLLELVSAEITALQRQERQLQQQQQQQAEEEDENDTRHNLTTRRQDDDDDDDVRGDNNRHQKSPSLSSSDALQPPQQRQQQQGLYKFPRSCQTFLSTLPGNAACLDCGQRLSQSSCWAAVSYGALICLQCSGHHRSLGVHVSCVRSVALDDWTVPHMLQMLEGGNGQLLDFFQRHGLTPETMQQQQQQSKKGGTSTLTTANVTRLRYKTKAALFYRKQMAVHSARLLSSSSLYQPREQSQRLKQHRLDHRNSTVE